MKDEASILAEALKIQDSDARQAYLNLECGDNVQLREELERLLKFEQAAGNFLEMPPGHLELPTNLGIPANGWSLDDYPSVLRVLGERLDEVPQITLRQGFAEGEDPIVRTNSEEMPESRSQGRYELHGEIARGGMGAILHARDRDLGRDLAIKVLLESHANKPDVLRRFIEEAQIGGQLQHPGIAPVYELGRLDDARPYFSMKLVKGRTLSALLSDRKSLTEDRGRYLGIFEQICQAMAYSHSRGVIHRDLKPANIMVGAFGEVQVMDWGLAKVLKEGGIADEQKERAADPDASVIATNRSVGSDTPDGIDSDTRAGSIMGTPSYLPPEQALGHVEDMNERSDVFGLGAILGVILTGQPPYVADDGTKVYRMAQQAKLDECFARLDGCEADAQLVQLAKDCLQPDQKLRPRDAGEVSQRISAYLESVETKLRETEIERAAEAARVVESRKRLRVTLALAASVLLLFSVVGGGWMWTQQQAAERREFAKNQVNDAINKAFIQQGRAETGELRDQQLHLDLAVASAKQAVDLVELDHVDPELASRAKKLLADLTTQSAGVQQLAEKIRKNNTFQAELDLIRLSQSDGLSATVTLKSQRDPASGLAEFTAAGSTSEAEQSRDLRSSEQSTSLAIFNIDTSIEQYERAFWESELDLQRLSITDAVAQIRESDIRETLIAAIDNWARAQAREKSSAETTAGVSREKLLAIAAAADDSEWRKTVRTALDAGDTEQLKELAISDESRSQSPELMAWLGAALREGKETATSIELLKQALKKHPDDFWLNYELGKSLSQNKQYLEALGYARAAMVIRPNSLGANMALAVMNAEAKNYDEALAFYQQVTDQRPDLVEAQSGMALIYMTQENWDEAITACRKALEVTPDNGELRGILALALRQSEKMQQVWEGLFQAREAVRRDRNNSLAHLYYGRVMAGFEMPLYNAFAREAYEISTRLSPQNAQSHYHLGELLARIPSTRAAAIASLRSAIAADRHFAAAYVALSRTLRGLGDDNSAMAVLEDGLHEIPNDPGLLAASAEYSLWRNLADEALTYASRAVDHGPYDPVALRALGNALRAKGNHAESRRILDRAVDLSPSDEFAADALFETTKLSDHLSHLDAWVQILKNHPNCSLAAVRIGAILNTESEIDLETLLQLPVDILLEIAPTNSGTKSKYLRANGGMVRLWGRIVERHPESADAYFGLGMTLSMVSSNSRNLDGCLAAFIRASELAPSNAGIFAELGNLYLANGNYSASESACRKGLQLDPADLRLQVSLARVLHVQKRLEESEFWYKRATESIPFASYGLDDLIGLLKARGRNEEAERHGRKLVELNPIVSTSWQQLYSMLEAQNRENDAIDFFETVLDNAVNDSEKLSMCGCLESIDGVAEKILAKHPEDPMLRFLQAREHLKRRALDLKLDAEIIQKVKEDLLVAFDLWPKEELVADSLIEVLTLPTTPIQWQPIEPEFPVSNDVLQLTREADGWIRVEKKGNGAAGYVTVRAQCQLLQQTGVQIEYGHSTSTAQPKPPEITVAFSHAKSHSTAEKITLKPVPMLVGHIPASQDLGRRTSISFQNRLSEPVVVYWNDWQHQLKVYRGLLPGGSYQQETEHGHVWVVKRASNGEFLGVFTGTPEPSAAVITDPPFRHFKGTIAIPADSAMKVEFRILCPDSPGTARIRLSATDADLQLVRKEDAVVSGLNRWTRLAVALFLTGDQARYHKVLDEHPDVARDVLLPFGYLGEWQQGIGLCDRTCVLEPTNPYHVEWRAQAFIALKQWDQAKTEFLKLIELDAKNAASALSSFRQVKQWKYVIELCEVLLAREPMSSVWLAERAQAHMALGQWDQAKKDWQQALELKPSLITFRCESYETAESWKTATDVGLKWIDQSPDVPGRWLHVATVLALSENMEEYAAFCERAAAQFAGTETAGTSEAVTTALLLLPGAIDPAKLPTKPLIDYLDKTPTVESGYLPWFWTTRALLAYRSDDAAAAIECVARAEQHKPVDVTRAMALSILALAQHKLGKTDEAAATLEQATQLVESVKQKALATGSNNVDVEIAEILNREATQVIGAAQPSAEEAPR